MRWRVYSCIIMVVILICCGIALSGCKSEPPESIFDELMIIKAQQERITKRIASKNVRLMCPLNTRRGGDYILYPGGTTVSEHMKACETRFGRRR